MSPPCVCTLAEELHFLCSEGVGDQWPSCRDSSDFQLSQNVVKVLRSKTKCWQCITQTLARFSGKVAGMSCCLRQGLHTRTLYVLKEISSWLLTWGTGLSCLTVIMGWKGCSTLCCLPSYFLTEPQIHSLFLHTRDARSHTFHLWSRFHFHSAVLPAPNSFKLHSQKTVEKAVGTL